MNRQTSFGKKYRGRISKTEDEEPQIHKSDKHETSKEAI